MMSVLQEVNAAVNGFVWGVPAMVAIIGAGLWLSFRMRFIQFTRASVVSVASGCFGVGCITVIKYSLGAVLALLIAGVLLGGIKRIGSFAVRVVPFMALLFILLGIGVIVMNIWRVPNLLGLFLLSGTLVRILRGDASREWRAAKS